MANYTIIGGDQKEYGPISADDVRQWIAEGRLSEQSLIKVEGAAEFRPLGTFAEFGDAFTSGGSIPKMPPVFNATENGGRAAVLSKVKSPAVALKVTAILNGLFALWGLVKIAFFRPNLAQLYAGMPQLNDPQVQKILEMANGPLGIVDDLFALAMCVLILIGASKMQSLRSYEFSFAAAILAMVPCLTPCCLLGLPFGIWALMILCKPEVKAQFN